MSENTFHNITYPNMFWLFIVGSIIGVVLEGIWCLVKNGQWMSLIRWKNRHEGKPPVNAIGRLIDEKFGDKKMEKRFIEWHFIDE